MRNPIQTGHSDVELAAVAGKLGVMFVGATLPTPLYPLYREAFGFSAVTLTLIYATYDLGNLAALLFFGPLSDQIGRRATSLPLLRSALPAPPFSPQRRARRGCSQRAA
jgi:MFS family permease